MLDLTQTVIAFARARYQSDPDAAEENLVEWARQNLDGLSLCVVFAEAKAHAEETEDVDLEASLEGLIDLFVSF